MTDRGTVEIMTLRLARDMASRIRRGGWQVGPQALSVQVYEGSWVRCPLCEQEITLISRPHERRYKVPSAREWTDTIVRHFTWPDAEDRCPQVRSVTPAAAWKGTLT